MLKIIFEFEPSQEEISKYFPLRSLSVDDFLEWMTDAKTNVDKVNDYGMLLKQCDEHYKSMFVAYFNPSNIVTSVHRYNSNDRFRYTYRCEFEYPLEKFEENLFAYKIVNNHSKIEWKKTNKRIKLLA